MAVFVTVGDPAAGHSRGSLGTWVVVAVVIGPAMVLCVLGARIWSGGQAAAVLLAVVAGSSLALFAVLTKGIVEAVSGGFGALLRAPELMPGYWPRCGDDVSAVVVSRRRADRFAADDDRGQAGGGLAAGCHGARRDAGHRRAEGLALIVAAVLVVIATIALARGEAATMAAGVGRDVIVADKAPSNS